MENPKVYITSKIVLTVVILVEVALTKMSSKGQVVIPAEMRVDIPEGEKLLIIQAQGRIIMKKASDLDRNVAEDIAFARRTEQAWKRIEKGKGIKMGFDKFVASMKEILVIYCF